MDKTDLIKKTEAHFEAVKAKRIDEILNFYSTSEELLVFVEGPRWATLGYEKVSKGWRDFADSAISVENCEWIENLNSRITRDAGFVAGLVEMKVNIKGETKIIRFRGTFNFEKTPEGDWKVIHEHFSQPAADPYGIGDWLKP